MASSMPEDTPSLEGTSTYTSRVSVQTSHRRGSTTVGLGISDCGLDPSFDPMRWSPNHVPFTMGSNMLNHLMPTEDLYNPPLEADDFCGRSCYQIYSGLPVPSHSPLSFDGPRTMNTTHHYNPAMEIRASQNMFAGQMGGMPGLWANTPVSGPTSPLQSIPIAAARTMESHWNPEIYPETSVVPPLAWPVTGTSYPPIPPTSEGNASGSTRHRHSSPVSVASSPQGTPTGDGTAEAAAKPNKRGRKPVEKGCECRVCGFYFTRRSNCLAHQKRHDPSFHRAIPCEECSKSFGRNSDLRRHIDTVSGKQKKDGPVQC
ncbi:uncharacterized protein N7482_006439 [Penicillium canariense]|uniref:C2H2-type domain-containing protein n=1 Tax=Penicillium canariense TaxID=189055 RepID=A0A9W9HXB6_9EURO|nr:uncharacterized protein N7482_006439 [Penicillium canariense]KAJ5159435.1 hypothetical protein N7482_006439 [Penicillium canariense]